MEEYRLCIVIPVIARSFIYEYISTYGCVYRYRLWHIMNGTMREHRIPRPCGICKTCKMTGFPAKQCALNKQSAVRNPATNTHGNIWRKCAAPHRRARCWHEAVKFSWWPASLDSWTHHAEIWRVVRPMNVCMRRRFTQAISGGYLQVRKCRRAPFF